MQWTIVCMIYLKYFPLSLSLHLQQGNSSYLTNCFLNLFASFNCTSSLMLSPIFCPFLLRLRLWPLIFPRRDCNHTGCRKISSDSISNEKFAGSIRLLCLSQSYLCKLYLYYSTHSAMYLLSFFLLIGSYSVSQALFDDIVM